MLEQRARFQETVNKRNKPLEPTPEAEGEPKHLGCQTCSGKGYIQGPNRKRPCPEPPDSEGEDDPEEMWFDVLEYDVDQDPIEGAAVSGEIRVATICGESLAKDFCLHYQEVVCPDGVCIAPATDLARQYREVFDKNYRCTSAACTVGKNMDGSVYYCKHCSTRREFDALERGRGDG